MAIQTLGLNTDDFLDDVNVEPVGFWKRQFLPTPTKRQTQFDWAYGVCVPLICVAADPIVFTGSGGLSQYKVLAYMLSATSIMGMAAWLLWGKRLGWLGAPLGGLFIAGSFVSFIVGMILLPISLIAMFFLIGFLGFTPLFAALVYLRNGLRALDVSSDYLDENSVVRAAIVAAMLALVIPYVANVNVMPATGRVQHEEALDGFKLVNR